MKKRRSPQPSPKQSRMHKARMEAIGENIVRTWAKREACRASLRELVADPAFEKLRASGRFSEAELENILAQVRGDE